MRISSPIPNFFGRLIAILPALWITACTSESHSIDYLGQTPPGMQAELFAPDLISTNNYEHSAPAFSPDGTTVLWTVVNKTYRGSLFEMTYVNGKWSAPHRPSFADTTADDYYPSFSADGKKLYFSSRRKVPSGYTPTSDMRIWEVERTADGWGVPIPFDTVASKGIEYAHSIAANGAVYFSSPLGGGTNMNIQKTESQNGKYMPLALIPFSINSVDYEDGPYISPDESFLIFESQRPEGIEGSLDLYISFKLKDGQWSLPVNMGPTINSKSSERFAKLSPDGKYLFFGSNRNMSAENWGFDIFWIDAKVIDELRNNEISQTAIEQALGEELIDALYKNEVDRSEVGLKKWLSSYPNSLDAIVIYSSVLRKQKNYAEAEKLLNNTAPDWNKNVSILMEKALVKFGLNKDDAARTLLAPLLQESARLRDRYMYLSNSLLDMKKFNLSDAYFEKAIAIHSNGYEYLRRARKLAHIGEKDKALEHLYKAVALGLNARQEFQNDPDLVSLQSDVRFQKLLETSD
ncbi:hypothetical protein GXP67_17370 [Rhodocytophaga rosea]|uniref:Tetratricopeptide repeat protein n=1 Tax=Rhodocytophaga rosea TaxID=2704465 RepID=A0A6C0GKU9_9BACT|nr:PD40 domain-containing protein [Rhodocytophaga rosea]QHT68283.1 hypothetical protein GXP67_17370 [Rhodocytophaga rosea]